MILFLYRYYYSYSIKFWGEYYKSMSKNRNILKLSIKNNKTIENKLLKPITLKISQREKLASIKKKSYF